MSDLLLVSTLDGGKCSTEMELSSSMRKVKCWRFLEVLIEKTRTLSSTTSTVKSNSSSISSMRTSGRRNQLKESSAKTLVSMLKDLSTLFLNFHQTNILI